MALSGTFYGTTSNSRIKPQIVWSAKQSVAGNYSDVTAKLQYTRSNSGYTTGGTWQGTLTINGEAKTDKLYMEITYGNVTTVLTNTVRVYHDSDGTKAITISATGGIVTPAEASLKTTEISKKITLDTIARAASVSATDCNIGSSSTVVVDKMDSSLTSSLAYKFGSLSGYITSGGEVSTTEKKFSGSVVNFQVPTSFYAQIPNAAQGTCYLTCNTYAGSTKIGSSTATFTATAAESLCAPTVKAAVTDTRAETVALTGDNQVLVLNASKATCTITATAKNSASITKKTIFGNTVSGTQLVLDPVTKGEIAFQAKDSRGYTTGLTYQAQTVPYVKLTANVTPKRDTPTGSTAKVTVTGKCFKGSFGLADNTLSLTLEVVETGKKLSLTPTLNGDNTYRGVFSLSGLPYDNSYTLRLTAADKLTTVTKSATLPRGVPVFDWGKGDFRFHVPVHMDKDLLLGGVSVLDLVYPVGSVYISFDGTNPAGRLGGTWKQILGQDNSDVFLCASSAGAGTYGGSANGLADQICVTPATVGGISSDATVGSYKSRILVTRNSDYTNPGTDGAQLLSAVGTGSHYQNKNLPPYVKVFMWRRTA